MADSRLQRVLARLQNLPAIALPTDYPSGGTGNVVEAVQTVKLSEQAAVSLLKLAVYDEDDGEEEEVGESTQARPSAFNLLLAAFAVLLHRYTGDNDMVIASSSASAKDPLLLRLSIDPLDSFWAVVRQVQHVEKEAEEDAVPFSSIAAALKTDDQRPLFRVRFFDETDYTQEDFLRSTSLTTDLTIFVLRPAEASSHASLTPHITLRILYNSLLFTHLRINFMVEQLTMLLRKVSSSPLAAVGSIPLLTQSQRGRLPSPIGDLHWCDYKGAITDVFSRNAQKWPERPCVIQYLPLEEPSKSQGRRVYTYGTIRRASNVLAHHLLQGGIKREEVVTVYAHRSVDLVVAVMAVLKVGATFSVIGLSFLFTLVIRTSS